MLVSLFFFFFGLSYMLSTAIAFFILEISMLAFSLYKNLPHIFNLNHINLSFPIIDEERVSVLDQEEHVKEFIEGISVIFETNGVIYKKLYNFYINLMG